MSTVSLDVVVSQGKNQVFSELNDEVVLLNLEKAQYFCLDSMGKVIWYKIAEPIPVAELVAQLCNSYNGPKDEIEKDVISFLSELEKLDCLWIE